MEGLAERGNLRSGGVWASHQSIRPRLENVCCKLALSLTSLAGWKIRDVSGGKWHGRSSMLESSIQPTALGVEP